MKKILRLTIIAICTGIIIPCNLYSADITAGATAWYAWGGRSENLQEDISDNKRSKSYSFDPTLLCGPALSVKFSNSFNLTFVYLYGKFNFNEGDIGDEHPELHYSFSAKSKAKRSDSDLALNYRLNDYFKVFAGIKYMAYETNLSYDISYTDGHKDHCYNHAKHTSIGPGLGVSSTLPLTDNIFLLTTLSGFYLFSSGEKFQDYKIYNNYDVDYNIAYNEYGINTTISVAYYITQLSTVISLGGRFQYFVINYAKYEDFLINSIANKIYGITLTATYSFSF